jgi:hypothetical protein
MSPRVNRAFSPQFMEKKAKSTKLSKLQVSTIAAIWVIRHGGSLNDRFEFESEKLHILPPRESREYIKKA